MAWGREDFEWERVSHLMAVIFNSSIWDSSKTKPKQPRDFNPLRQDDESIAADGDRNDPSYQIVAREASRPNGQ